MSAKTSRQEISNVLSHWHAFIEGAQFSAQEFYASVENELVERKMPRLETSRIDFHEESLISDKRVYLRLARERFAFDICAAPFGTGYFFSLRMIEKRRSWSRFIVLSTLACVVFGICISFARNPLMGLIWFLGIALGCLLIFRLFLSVSNSRDFPNYEAAFRNPATPDEKLDAITIMQGGGFAEDSEVGPGERGVEQEAAQERTTAQALSQSSAGGFDLDGWLLNTAVVGTLYERARTDTYYRYDTRLLFQNIIIEIVKQKVETLTSAKGVKLSSSYEYSPLLDGLYKRATVAAPVKDVEAALHAVS